MPLLEIACFNPESALLAQAHGASRVELCAEQVLGGVTPLLSDFISVKSKLSIPINVMIRPRGGGFVYSAAERERMKREIEMFGREGVDGFVFGVLTAEGKVDGDACRELLGRTAGRKCTFHRAFDEIPEEEMEDALEELIELGFTSVLTSGGRKNAIEGKEVLARLVRRARGRIEIIVGGGVRSGNLDVLIESTRAEAFHSSAVVGEGDVASGEEVERLRGLLR
ncbi:putative copper homeostasis protein [Leptodontidium sp. MPI-SDFR-AT-0119]|nr:putative copper homeostasis protein [Leptodontidium sp. MPI-SDFR-AT-0119]